MNKQRTGNREQQPIENMLRQTILPMEKNPEPAHDLWPALQARLNEQPQLGVQMRSVPWFDWALAASLAAFALAFPAAVPMILYYL